MISEATLQRLTQIYRTLSRMARKGDECELLSSTQLGKLIGVPSHTIRKDISSLGMGDIGNSGRGYSVEKLQNFIGQKLGLTVAKRTAIIGLGRIGSALLEYGKFSNAGFSVVAGFDSSINRIDLLKTDVPLYCSYDIAEVVKREKIELAFLAVPASSAEQSMERLVEGGIKGIVNFSPMILQNENNSVFIRNVDLSGELTMLSALISVNNI